MLDNSQEKRDGGNLSYDEHLNRLLDGLRSLDLSGSIVEETPYLQAHGAFCDIFKAKSRKHGDMIVAVKRLRVHVLLDKNASKAAFRELRVWSSLSHPNVLPLLGFVMHEENFPAFVSQWMINGSVRAFMERSTDYSLLRMAKGIAAGLLYLHEKEIVHSDLKSDNILVSDAGDPLLADFGISRIKHITTGFSSTHTSSGAMGTVRWMAIEFWLPNLDGAGEAGTRTHTKQTDVWAFGMVLYELLTGKIPFYHLKSDMLVPFFIANGETPAKPSTLDNKIHNFVWLICQRCWTRSPLDRPTVSWICERLNGADSNIAEATEVLETHSELERASQVPIPESDFPELTHVALNIDTSEKSEGVKPELVHHDVFGTDSEECQAHHMLMTLPPENWRRICNHKLLGMAAAYHAACAFTDNVSVYGFPETQVLARSLIIKFARTFIVTHFEARALTLNKSKVEKFALASLGKIVHNPNLEAWLVKHMTPAKAFENWMEPEEPYDDTDERWSTDE